MDQKYIAQQCTAIIKTFERPDKLCALVDSIRRYYPLLPIVIIDDSANKLEHPWDVHTAYYPIAYDVGVSEGRNIAIRQVRTPYALLLDDDFRFTENTKIERLLAVLENHHFDLVAGDVIDYGQQVRLYRGDFEISHNKLYLKHKAGNPVNGCYPRFDYVVNFFLAKTDLLKQSPWDPELKIQEHEVFFWNLKKVGARITSIKEVSIDHYPAELNKKSDVTYCKMRYDRIAYFQRMACQKIGVNDFISDRSLYDGPLGLFSWYAIGVHWIESNKQKKRSAQMLWYLWQPTRPVFQLVYRCWRNKII